jgi:hypothetical protein
MEGARIMTAGGAAALGSNKRGRDARGLGDSPAAAGAGALGRQDVAGGPGAGDRPWNNSAVPKLPQPFLFP